MLKWLAKELWKEHRLRVRRDEVIRHQPGEPVICFYRLTPGGKQKNDEDTSSVAPTISGWAMA